MYNFFVFMYMLFFCGWVLHFVLFYTAMYCIILSVVWVCLQNKIKIFVRKKQHHFICFYIIGIFICLKIGAWPLKEEVLANKAED